MNNTPESANIVITAQESSALLELIDLAVKSAGLRVAGSAAFLHQKIDTAFKPTPAPAPEA
jgi:hypothetical protein